MEALIQKLRLHNIDVQVVHDQIKLTVPKGLRADDIIGEVRRNKQELIAFIGNTRHNIDFRTIAPCPEQAHYVLSSAQKRLWFLHQLDKTSLAYNMPYFVNLGEGRGEEEVRRAFAGLIARHESLRTTFAVVNGEPRQKIAPRLDFAIEHYRTTRDQAPAVMEAFIRPFDLGTGPLIRAGLLVTESEEGRPGEQLLLTDMHHIISDGVSGGILAKELIALYNHQELPPLRLQYKDYAEWQQDAGQQEQIAKQKTFWLKAFAQEPPALDLPADFPRQAVRNSAGGRVSFGLGAAETAELKAIAESEGATPFMAILAVYTILLGKLSNQEDVVVGVPAVGRPHADLENIMGMFVNSLALRNFPTGTSRFREYLRGLKYKTLDCFDNQTYQFEELVNELKPRRETSRNPLFDVMFVFQADGSTPPEPAAPPGAYATEHRVAKFDLTLTAADAGGAIGCSFEYATTLFTPETIGRFAAYFQRIVAAVTRNPDVRIADIGLLDAEETNKLLCQFNDTTFPYPEYESVTGLFARQVSRNPAKVAVRAGNAEVTYGQLDDQANRLAARLRQRGAAPGETVAILLERSIACIASILAVLKNGGVYLPMDVGNPDERINFMLNDSKARFLLTRESITGTRAVRLPEHTLGVDEDPAAISPGPASPQAEVFRPEHVYIIYTSGSTGVPKGVVGSRKGLLNRLYWGWEHYPFAAREVCCQKTSLSFVDHVAEVFAPLLGGVPLVILGEHEGRDPEAMLRVLIENNVSRITLVPSLLEALIRVKKAKNIRLDALRYVFCSGETLGFHLARKFYAEFGRTRLVNIYGSSEVGADVTCYKVDRFHVEEVLTYFKNSLDAGGTPEAAAPGGAAPGFTSRNVKLEEIAGKFTESRLAAYPLSVEEYYDKLHRDVIPYTINTAAPTFIGHMTSVLPDYVHDLSKLISQLNQNLVKIETSKSVTFLEREALAILHRTFYAFPDAFYRQYVQKLNHNLGIITSGGSTANLSALLSARNKALAAGAAVAALGEESIYALLQRQGYRDMVLIGSELMHYSFRKALSVLGIGTKNIICVENDEKGRMCPRDLENKIAACRQDNLLIMAIVGIAGSTERGSIDPLPEIARIAARHGIHFHVDAAWGGALIFSDDHKHLIRGIEQADSITFCGHKQLFLPQGISLCLFRDPAQLGYNATTAHYQAAPDSFDTGRFTIEGSRPALSICLHASLRVIGKKGYELLINNSLEKTAAFAAMLAETPAFELISSQINILNYRYVPARLRRPLQGGQLTAEMNREISRVNQEVQAFQFYAGKTFVSKTTIRDPRYGEITVLRAVISNPLTTHDDLINVLKDQFAIVEALYGEGNALYDEATGAAQPLPAGADDAKETRMIPIGKPLHNTQILVLDPYRQLQPIGVPGDVYVSGDGVAAGYWERPDLTEKAFVPNPFREGAVMYRTGDRGRWLPDGNLQFMGRTDNQVKIRGFRIELEEIQQALGQRPDVDQVVVAVKEKEGGPVLVAYYVAEQEPGEARLREYLAARLPDYMVPARFVRLESLPLTPNGKLDRKALPDPGFAAGDDHAGPADELEARLVAIWAEVLGLAPEQVSVTRTFFELGGHSLMTPVLFERISSALHISFHVSTVFQFQSIRALAGHIARNVPAVPAG